MFKLPDSNCNDCATAGTYLCIDNFILIITLRWVKLSDINNWASFPFIKCVKKFIFTECHEHKLISACEKIGYCFKYH